MPSVIRGNDNFDSSAVGAMIKLSSGSAGGVQTFEVTLTGSYRRYQLHLDGLTNITNSNNTHYLRYVTGSTLITSGYRAAGASGQAYIRLGITDTNAAGSGICGTLDIINPHDTSFYTDTVVNALQMDNGTIQHVAAYHNNGSDAAYYDITAVQVTCGVGTWNKGNWTLYGVV